ncbi:MAG: hypothetical protein BJ554DRAFT_848, partial [Olpidium bornovanus]
ENRAEGRITAVERNNKRLAVPGRAQRRSRRTAQGQCLKRVPRWRNTFVGRDLFPANHQVRTFAGAEERGPSSSISGRQQEQRDRAGRRVRAICARRFLAALEAAPETLTPSVAAHLEMIPT